MAYRDPGQRRPAGAQTEWMTLGQAAKYLGVAQSTIRKWSDVGRVPAFYTPGRSGRRCTGCDPAGRDDAAGRRLGDAPACPGTARDRLDPGRDVQRPARGERRAGGRAAWSAGLRREAVRPAHADRPDEADPPRLNP